MATNFVAKMGQNYLPPALITLSFRKIMGYRYLNVRINSANEASIRCANFVKFGPVTSELTGLINFVNVRYKTEKKTCAFHRISPDVLDRFSQTFHRMKALYMQLSLIHISEPTRPY